MARTDIARPLAAPLVAGLAWAALCAWLHVDGHAPSAGAPGVPRSSHYLWQAVFVAPLVVALAAVFSAVATRVACGSRVAFGRQERPGPTPRLALAAPYGLCLLFGFVLPDLIAYAASGFAALAVVLRVTGPVTAVALVASGATVLRWRHRVSLGRALGASVAGFVAQAALGAPLLR
jgi:hypothetical protein